MSPFGIIKKLVAQKKPHNFFVFLEKSFTLSNPGYFLPFSVTWERFRATFKKSWRLPKMIVLRNWLERGSVGGL
jgi:hypothetical protein